VGKHGRRYASHVVRDCPNLELAAVCRRDPVAVQALATEYSCRAYTDYQELIAAVDVDAVIVAVPPVIAEDVVTAALSAGKPVLLEKPAAASLEAGRRLQALQDRCAVPVMVAHTLRYNGVVRALRTRLPDVGNLHSVALTQRFEPSLLDWIDDPARSGGGMVLHTGVHSFDLLRFFTDLEIEAVGCLVVSLHTKRTEDGFVATLRLGGGQVLATVCSSRAARGRTGYIELAGDQATLVGDHVGNWAHVVRGTEIEPIPLGAPVPTVREVLHAFAAVVERRLPPPISLEEGVRAVAVAEACYAAVRSASVVPVTWP
jgi:predicted dehydrogenase